MLGSRKTDPYMQSTCQAVKSLGRYFRHAVIMSDKSEFLGVCTYGDNTIRIYQKPLWYVIDPILEIQKNQYF